MVDGEAAGTVLPVDAGIETARKTRVEMTRFGETAFACGLLAGGRPAKPAWPKLAVSAPTWSKSVCRKVSRDEGLTQDSSALRGAVE